MAKKTNDLKTIHDVIAGMEIPIEMEFDPKDITFQYAHFPYVGDKTKWYGMPESEEDAPKGDSVAL